MAKNDRELEVQVPGEQLADQPEGAGADTSADNAPAQPQTEKDKEALIQRLLAENEALRAAQAAAKADDVSEFASPSQKYANTHSSKVDRSKISAPVLCKDGWLVP